MTLRGIQQRKSNLIQLLVHNFVPTKQCINTYAYRTYAAILSLGLFIGLPRILD